RARIRDRIRTATIADEIDEEADAEREQEVAPERAREERAEQTEQLVEQPVDGRLEPVLERILEQLLPVDLECDLEGQLGLAVDLDIVDLGRKLDLGQRPLDGQRLVEVTQQDRLDGDIGQRREQRAAEQLELFVDDLELLRPGDLELAVIELGLDAAARLE